MEIMLPCQKWMKQRTADKTDTLEVLNHLHITIMKESIST